MSARKQANNEATSVNKKRVAYALAAGAAVASIDVMDANAEVVYSGSQEISIELGSSQSIQFDTDPYADVKLKNYYFGGGPYQGLTVNFAPGKVAGFQIGSGMTAVDYVSALTLGTVVDSVSAGPDFKGSLAYGSLNPNAQFNNITDGYIGLSFPIGGNTADKLHFAWMRVSIDNTLGSFIIHDWAWEGDAGVGIVVGDTGPTAVPGDLNGDGEVTGRDFLAWQRGETDPSFSVDSLAEWQASYNGGALAGLNAVPEPMTLGLLAGGASGLVLMRRLRQR